MAKNKTTYESSEQSIPAHVYDSFARILLPIIKEDFNSGKWQKEFEQWKESQKQK